MAKNLLIVESPAKAKTIEGYLGKDFTVKSSYGHIRDLIKSEDAIDIAHNFEQKYEVFVVFFLVVCVFLLFVLVFSFFFFWLFNHNKPNDPKHGGPAGHIPGSNLFFVEFLWPSL